MPIYEYLCTACAHTFDAIQSITAAPLTDCPECGKTLKKCVSTPGGLQFKGSGFYITDYTKQKGAPKKGDTEGGKGKSTTGDKAGADKKKPSSDGTKSPS